MGIDIRDSHTVEVGYDEFCGALAARDLRPLWKIAKALMPEVPIPTTRPWLWRWDDVLPLAKRAGELISLERGGDRRVLAFANPGLGGLPFTSTTLWGAYQYLGPRENAPAHRHTASAIRFVVSGTGAYTTVDGDACDMEAGDLVLTPNWTWHDHNNDSDQPMIWFDGLDLPLATTLESIFFENHPDSRQPVAAHNQSADLFGGAGLRELGATSGDGYSPLLRYRWAETDRTLEALHRRRGGPIASLEYTNPVSGAPVVPTLSCEMHRVYPGERSPTRRRTGSSVYVVFHGHGRTVISGQAFEWGPGDVFVTPSWAEVDHEATGVADLFAVTDRPVLQALHLYREQVSETHQAVEATFPS
jgi:gentisate 1,2-dioxygenase